MFEENSREKGKNNEFSKFVSFPKTHLFFREIFRIIRMRMKTLKMHDKIEENAICKKM